jgi:hypothetical protein
MLKKEDISVISTTEKTIDQIQFQYKKLCSADSWTRIKRPAIIDDGIRTIAPSNHPELVKLHDTAAAAGRISSFIPASGSGSRLFKDLLKIYGLQLPDSNALKKLAEEGNAAAGETLKTLRHIKQLAIWESLRSAGCSGSDPLSILEALFGSEGLAVDNFPKGLLPFHQYPSEARTAFEEHLIEACILQASSERQCAAHFTVSAHHLALFEHTWSAIKAKLEQKFDLHLKVDFSFQDPVTDMIAINSDGTLLRNAQGQIEFRPGGHGSLLNNLANSGNDIVLLKNIDNVCMENRLYDTVPIRKRLSGLLVQLETKIHHAIRELRQGKGLAEALRLIETEFNCKPAASCSSTHNGLFEFALNKLNRPLRVAGVIKNQGQPGGGPFWVDVPGYGCSLQIVETSQVDIRDAGQQEILMSSTHFNPVIMACTLRDVDNKRFNLADFTDPDALIITEKSQNGHPIRVIEHPGLWCGSMAKWNTVFVEIPSMLFNPVKVFSDLLQNNHCNQTNNSKSAREELAA